MSKFNLKASLLATTVIAGFAVANPAFAQTAPPPAGDTTSQDVNSQATTQSDTTDATPPSTAAQPGGGEIVVTGTITRNPAAATASPVVSVTADDIQKRGITTVTEYLQTLSANNAGTVPPSWSVNGFTPGASAPSLRGFNDAYTLVLFDGMRSAVYPLADDTQRNITDINTIPAWSVARIDTLLDGASATYGSDAIAGVVNVITKSELQGLHANGSLGISQEGDAGEQRFSIAYGMGSLANDGWNVYAGVEWQHNDALYAGDRDIYPFNTSDRSGICDEDGTHCLANGIRNGLRFNNTFGGFSSSSAAAVRPFDPADVTPDGFDPADAAGRFQYLNGCQGLTPFTLTGAQLTNTQGNAGASAPADGVVCQQDLIKDFSMYNAEITRKGATLRGTKRFGDHEIFASFNYYNTKTYNSTAPRTFTYTTAAGGPNVNISGIFLPVYVCPQGTATVGTTDPETGDIAGPAISSGCNAQNGTLNPNNPFAAQGQLALLSALPNRPRETTTNTKTYRAAIGAHGEFGDGFSYNVGATASKVTLDYTNKGYIFVQGLLDAVAQGTYNFVDQNANSQAAIDQVFPENHSRKNSKMWQVQGALAKDLIELPGGWLNVAVGAQYRHESLNNPSSNPPNEDNPYARYYDVNAVGVKGSRNVWSLSYEIAAPILDTVRVKASGSYDHYSTGQKAFSPKFEAEWKVIQELKLRGTMSRGFRAPNFNESFQLPATGFIGQTVNCQNPIYTAFCAAHPISAYYENGYNIGLTSAGNPSLKPEKSTGYTLGAVFQPKRNLTFTVDFWRTKIKDLIVPQSVTNEILQAYYSTGSCDSIPGVVCRPGSPDTNAPNALPTLGFVEAAFQNANAFLGKGLDFSADLRVPLFSGIRLRSFLTASYLLKLQQINDNGTVFRFDGSLGPCNWTSCSGAPKWRATWQNTFDFSDRFNMTLTANYTSGYSVTAADNGGTYKDCIQSALDGGIVSFPGSGGDPVQCYGKSTFWMDAHAEYKPLSFLTLYGDVLNVFNRKPNLDVNAAYGIYGFNAAWQDRLFVGRYFRIGARVDMDPRPAVAAPYVAPAAPPPPPATTTCPDGSVVAAGAACPVAAPPPPPATSGERGR